MAACLLPFGRPGPRLAACFFLLLFLPVCANPARAGLPARMFASSGHASPWPNCFCTPASASFALANFLRCAASHLRRMSASAVSWEVGLFLFFAIEVGSGDG